MSSNRMDEEDILFHSIAKDTEFNKSTLKLAMVENDPNRLETMLKGIQIRDKKELLTELKRFVDEDIELKDEKKDEYKKAIKENEELYKEIERVIADKLHLDIEEIEEHEGDIIGYEGIRDTVSNFRNSSEEIMFRANLISISNTQRVLQEEFQTINITEENAEKILGIMNDVIDTSANWLKYLKSQSEKGKFDLYKEEFWGLMDETIKESKKTLRITEAKRQEIADRFPEIARRVDEKEEREQRNRENSDGDER